MSLQSKKRRRHTRRTLDKGRLVVKLSTRDDGLSVLATVRGWGAHAWAKHDQTIAGDRWEAPRDLPGFAYALLCNVPGLIDELRGEGYRLDLSEYDDPPATWPDEGDEADREWAASVARVAAA